MKLRLPTLPFLIFRPSARILLWIAGVSLIGVFFFSCGSRASDKTWSEKEVAAKVAYEIQQARFAERLAFAELERDAARAALDSATVRTDAIAKQITPTRRVVSVIPTGITQDSMTSVCLDSPPGCFPAHAEIAALVTVQDSMLRLVTTHLIPSFEAERAQAKRVIDSERMAFTLLAEMHEGTKARLRDVEKAHAMQHTPSKWQKIRATTRDLSIVGGCTALGILTVNVGVGGGCAILAGAVLR